MTTKRRNYSAAFKAKVALEALKDDLTVAELMAKHGVHQTLINPWKRQACVDGPCSASMIFDERSGSSIGRASGL